MKKILFSLLFVFAFCLFSFSQVTVYPSNWWVGMKHNKVQLLLKLEKDFFSQKSKVNTINKGIKVNKVLQLENRHYLLIDITIEPNATIGTNEFSVSSSASNFGAAYSFNFELKPRRPNRGKDFAQGVTSEDLVYLLMPERFSNGDKSNDKIAGMLDQSLNRDSIYTRHGGDLQGVTNHLDYLQKLGVTALWMTPVLENNQPNRTEHGYAFTNHYSIDPRFGGANAYKKLSDALHKRGMKLIQDAVYNHIGDKHILFTDAPAKDWFHQWDTFTKTSYKDQPIFDPYSSAKDRKVTQDGWFTKEMPDWNQSNPYVANFLIQHAIWSVEEFWC